MIAGLIGKREKLAQQIDASFLPESEKDYDRNTAVATLKLIMQLGWSIKKEQ